MQRRITKQARSINVYNLCWEKSAARQRFETTSGKATLSTVDRNPTWSWLVIERWE
jgi:hypothetical protein